VTSPRLAPLLALPLLAAACAGRQQSDGGYLRVVAEDGRIYYARVESTFFSDTGGFVSFRDLVTREKVQLARGTFVARFVPQSEVATRQQEYLEPPHRVPMATDKDLE